MCNASAPSYEATEMNQQRCFNSRAWHLGREIATGCKYLYWKAECWDICSRESPRGNVNFLRERMNRDRGKGGRFFKEFIFRWVLRSGEIFRGTQRWECRASFQEEERAWTSTKQWEDGSGGQLSRGRNGKTLNTGMNT